MHGELASGRAERFSPTEQSPVVHGGKPPPGSGAHLLPGGWAGLSDSLLTDKVWKGKIATPPWGKLADYTMDRA